MKGWTSSSKQKECPPERTKKKRDSFRKGENKVKTISPTMGWYRYSGPVEFIYVRWPFITWWSKEEQVDWWIKLQKIMQLKRKQKSKFFVGITDRQKKVYHLSWIYGCQPKDYRSVYSESQK